MNRILVVAIFLILAFSPGGWTIADQPDIASDEQQLADLSGNEKVDKLNDLAFAQWSRDPQKGLGFAYEAQKIAQKIGYKKGEARALNGLGVNNWGLSNHRLALECYLAAFDISRDIDDGKGMSNSLNNIGIIYTVLGSYEDSLGYFTQSLEIQKRLNDRKGTASTLNNVGLIYERLKSPYKAVEYYTQSLEIRREIADQRGIASSLNNLGSAFRSVGKYSEALGTLTEALLIFRKIDDPAGIASTLVSNGDLYAALGNHKVALDELTAALALSEKLGDRLLVATCLHKIGRSSIELDLLDEAELALNQALTIAEEIGAADETKQSHAFLARLYERRTDWEQAYSHMNAVEAIQSELVSSHVAEAISKMQIVKEVETGKREIKIRDLEIGRQKQMIRLYLQGIAMVALTALFLLYRYRLKVRMTTQLERLNLRLEELTRVDPLTQLNNRRGFMEKIELEQPRYERYRRPFCVIMSDIDDFKSINDKYGHGIGDEVLKGVAGILKDSTRTQDTVARWGGEEFILLLPETELDGASAIAERIRKGLETWSLNTAEGSIKVTITLGVAGYSSEDYPEDCIRRADAALYEGKAAGKNRVIVSSS